MSAKEERFCTLRHARNTSAQAKILKKTVLSMGTFLMQVPQVQVSVVSDGVL